MFDVKGKLSIVSMWLGIERSQCKAMQKGVTWCTRGIFLARG
jgi:hypothetical protein